ncbi:MAG: structural protein [Thermoplasmataceae archaeon]
MTRGERNNNPGNIRHGSKWLGLSSDQPDHDFCTFILPKYGIRAIMVIINTYNDKYGIDNVEGLIDRWAPSNENNSDSYVKDVCDRLSIGPKEFIDVKNVETLAKLTKAIIHHENGKCIYSDDEIKSIATTFIISRS